MQVIRLPGISLWRVREMPRLVSFHCSKTAGIPLMAQKTADPCVHTPVAKGRFVCTYILRTARALFGYSGFNCVCTPPAASCPNAGPRRLPGISLWRVREMPRLVSFHCSKTAGIPLMAQKTADPCVHTPVAKGRFVCTYILRTARALFGYSGFNCVCTPPAASCPNAGPRAAGAS